MFFDFTLATRLVFKKQKGFYNKARFFTIASIAISVAALLVSFSAFRGYTNVLTKIYKDSGSDIIVSDTSYSVTDLKSIVKNIDDRILDLKYFGFLELICAGKSNIRGVIFEAVEKGIFENKIINIDIYVKEGTYNSIFESNSVMIGSVLAELLGVKLGDTIKVFYIDGKNNNETKELKISAIFEYGLYDVDSRFAYISIETGSFLIPNSLYDNSLKIKVKNQNNTFLVADKLRTNLPTMINVKTWFDVNYSMFKAVEMDRRVIFIILTVLIAVAIFNVLTTLILLVRELKVEISILQILGMKVSRIVKLFFFKAIVFGLSGYLIGISIWLLLIFAVNKWGIIFIPKDIYLVSKIPVAISFFDIILVLCVVLFFSILGAVIPAINLNYKIKKEGVIYGTSSYKA